MKLPLSSLAWRSQNKIVRCIQSRYVRVLKEKRWMQIDSSILLINELDCMKKDSEIFTDILLENNWWEVENRDNFFVCTDIKWFTLNNIDKGHTALPYATSKSDHWTRWRGLASILPKVNNKAWNNTLSRLVMCQHLIAQSWASTSIFMPRKHHNIQKSKSYKDVFINLTASILELTIFSVFLESQRERYLIIIKAWKIRKSCGIISRKN